jgi:hypothetical protein
MTAADRLEDWRLFTASGAMIATVALMSGTRMRETIALRSAVVEMRNLARGPRRRTRAAISAPPPGMREMQSGRTLDHPGGIHPCRCCRTSGCLDRPAVGPDDVAGASTKITR